ncbi:GIN domain-containing protein [Aurantibacillus circumpalustris]|uniref:GIN domain-containing protein n=1 Tax=Aurantibacillus circumpalustris TaxID=3036359 RepID=UPI00295B7ED7|nr:DUF2807 domain-containing protein [Aurantibacillus circumpalustris]
MSKRSFIYLFFLALFVCCKKENAFDCFKSNGKEISDVRNPGNFRCIDVYDKIEVEVFEGNSFRVEVTAGENIIKNITTTIQNDTLKIQNKNTCNFVRGYKRNIKVNITMPYLKEAISNGVANLTIVNGFMQDSVKVRAEGSGDIFLSGSYSFINAYSNGNGDITVNGSANELLVHLQGTNFFNAQELIVKDKIFIENYSLGDSYLNAENLKKLEYIIFDKGNIYYTGIPSEISGILDKKSQGKLIKQD